MKELSVEEKAKAYDEKLDVARHIYADPSVKDEDKYYIEVIFPELSEESEDERIRKEIINYFEHYPNIIVKRKRKRDWIAWLEKHGEIIKEWSEMKMNNIQTELQEMVDLKQKTEQDEQNPTDKIEPKFHEGDIIIHKELGGDYIHNSHKIIQVDILDKKYRLEGGLVAHFDEQDDYELVEQKPAWSEEDEKLVKNLISTLSNLYARNLIEKETKEKYTNLLKSIKDRVQPQPKQEWSEEDKNMSRFIGNAITANDASTYLESKGIQVIDAHVWLEELEERVQPQPKQEWGDVDRGILFRTIDSLKFLKDTISADPNYAVNIIDIEREIAWLKSLRPQNKWKPTEELLDVFIKNATDFFESNFNPLTDGGVIGVFDDKKKMIEEFKEYMNEEGFNEEWI